VLSSHPSTNGFETDLGARVRALRRERGLTLKGLGHLARLSHPFLSQVERGLARPSVSSVERIAAALDVSVARLWSPPRQGEAIYVARGILEVDLDGSIHVLTEGDALRFDGAIPHRLRRSGGTQTRALIIAAA
jgi:transcriptional regulator with XRE-family HTH domain